ncbi:MAG: sugar phosphate isomerase/epimerase, partial [Clostridia bacterium]|nr:sugar phosphate isomerase/epimerase [Clostridia bacterium]
MTLSVFAVLLQDRSFEEACQYLASKGVQAVEIGCGGFPGKAHCDAKDFLEHPEKIEKMLETLNKYNLKIAALSTHGNAVHPNKEIARQFHEDFENAVLLAE